jgi:hypothetical protein
MENNEKFDIEYPETLEFFLQEIQYADGNKFLLTNTGEYVKMDCIMKFKPENLV